MGMGKYWLGVHKLSRELIEEFAKNIFLYQIVLLINQWITVVTF